VPDQVIRFYRLPGVANPQPLLVSDEPLGSIERCNHCGADRQVEFQVVSTLLSFLDDDHAQFDSLLVYTCSQNCDLGTLGWAQELVLHQSYSHQGVHFDRQDSD
jgi:pre-rRNA-processing protein TSR4